MSKVNVVFTGDMSRLAAAITGIQAKLQRFSFRARRSFVDLAAKVFLAEKAFGALNRVLGAPIRAAARFEDTRLALGKFMGDLALADELLQQLDQRSVLTPFEPEDMHAVAQSLLAAKIAGTEVFDIVNELAAVSKDGQQLGELGDALAKGFAKGKFQTEELNKFLERGINLRSELTAITGKSGEALDKAVQKGLKFEDVRQSIANLSKEGGLFYGMLEERSATASGKLSTLAGLWTEIQKRFATPINDSLKVALDGIIGKLTELLPLAQELGIASVAMFEGGLATGGALIGAVTQLFAALAPMAPLLLGLAAMWLAKKIVAIAALKGIAINTSSLRAQLFALRLATASAGGGFAGLRAAATVALSGIRAQVIALGVALRTALMASGVGIALIAVGEIIAKVSGDAMRHLQAAKSEARKVFDFQRQIEARQAAGRQVDSAEGLADLKKKLATDIVALRQELEDVELDVEGSDAQDTARENLKFRIGMTERMIESLDRQTAAQISDGDAKRAATKAAEEQAVAEADLQKKLQASTLELTRLRDAQLQREAADRLASMPLADQRRILQRRTGTADTGAFDQELDRLGRGLAAGTLPPEEIERFRQLLVIRKQLISVQQKEREADALRKKATADYDQRIKLLQAEIAGDKEKLELLKQQQRVRELEAEFREQGLSDPAGRARRLAELEARAEGRQGAGQSSSERQIIAQSISRIGGGGRAFTIDNRVLSESQRQSRLQERIARATEKSANQEPSGPAVFA